MFNKIKPVVSAEMARSCVPMPEGLIKQRNIALNEISDIIAGKDKRKLFIVGPCSADNIDAACDYAERLARIAERIKDKAYIVMRAYTCKQRTRGEGYMGLLHSPNPMSANVDLDAGLIASRRLHIRIASVGIFTADEIVYPQTVNYLEDVLCYASIGARSSESQVHRFAASGLDMPVGIKNPVGGSLSDLINGIHAVRMKNIFMLDGMQVETSGNASAHAVLRGAVDKSGAYIPNFGYDSVMSLYALYNKFKLSDPAVIIDAGHANSGKRPEKTAEIVSEVLDYARRDRDCDGFVKGFMFESYLKDGNCDGYYEYGKSITDPCLGWEKTERLLLSAADKIDA